jgi:ABC-type sulfate transport system permease component
LLPFTSIAYYHPQPTTFISLILYYYPIMKSFQAIIVAAIVASSAAINEPAASPAAAIERELAEYERQLGTSITGTPTGGEKPTPVSIISLRYGPLPLCLCSD